MANSMSYIQLVDVIRTFADEHDMVKRFFADFEEQISPSEGSNEMFPILFVAPVSNVFSLNVNTFTVRVFCLDMINDSRSNVNRIVSDSDLILNDLFLYLKETETIDVDIVSDPTTTPVNNSQLDGLAGCSMDLQIVVSSYSYCDIPLNTVDPGDACVILLSKLSTAQKNECILPSYDFADPDVFGNLTVEQISVLTGLICSGSDPVTISLNGTFYDQFDPGSIVDISILKQTGNTQVGSKVGPNWRISDSVISNSDLSYSVNLGAEENLNLPDITFTDTDGTTSSVPSVKNVSATLIPNLSCDQLNDVDDGLTSAQRQIIQQVNTLKTGQTTSYRTGDDGDLEKGRNGGFGSLSCNNPFGNTNRFTDQLGGSTYSDNIVVDWSTGLMWYRVVSSGNWSAAIDAALAATDGGYTDWYLPNLNQLVSITDYSQAGGVLNYAPFSIAISGISTRIWTSTTNPATTTNALILVENNAYGQNAKTQVSSYIYCRNFTYSGGSFS